MHLWYFIATRKGMKQRERKPDTQTLLPLVAETGDFDRNVHWDIELEVIVLRWGQQPKAKLRLGERVNLLVQQEKKWKIKCF